MTATIDPLLDSEAASKLRKVLVIQHWGIGDMLMTTPMLQALHQALPEARIEVVAGFAGAADVLRDSTYASVRAIARRQEGGTLGLARVFLSLRASRYDAAIIATRISSRMGQFARFVAGVPIVIGDGTTRSAIGYTRWRVVEPMQHRVDANMELARLLVAVPQTPEPRFDISRESQTRGAARWAAFGFEDRPVLAIHPGSSDASFIERRLPPDTVLQVIRAVLGGHPESRVLIILGPAEEALRQTFENCDPRIGIAAGVPLHETAYLLSRCKSLLVGDTGLGHLAAAVGTRVITIAGATQVAATRPWGTGNVVIRTKEQLACMPCYDTPLYGHCPYGARCLTSVMAADIVDAITPTLTEGRAEAP